MFELKAKNDQALISDFQQLIVTMNWTTSIDFDLFAVYEAKDGRQGIVYYADLGDLDAFPFMRLSGDEGQSDSGGENEESLIIANLDQMKTVWVCCWDYNKVTAGTSGRFNGSDVKLTIMDDQGASYNVPLAQTEDGNLARIATIDTAGGSIKLLNTSSSTTMNGLDPDQLLGFVKR